MKTYKYIIAAATVVVSGGLFTSCSDDDTTEIIDVPAAIELGESQTSLAWNEKEAYVNFSATQKWTAQSSASWIIPETIKGEAGEYRLFVTTVPNTYLLPRSGELTINCGDKSQTILFSQAGCSDPASVYSVNESIQMDPSGWSFYLMDFALYREDIEGNLGMSLSDFQEALQTLEMGMYMVDSDGKWDTESPYTADPQPGYWLDVDGNVATWDDGFGAYPGNAFYAIAFAEEDYFGLEFLRGDNVPQGAYDLKVVFSPVNDHSRYLQFNVELVCPVYEPIVEVTINADNSVNIKAEIVGEYNPTVISFEALEPAVTDALGISAEELAALCDEVSENLNVYFVEADGNLSDSYTANGFGFWLNNNNEICSWGEEGFCWYIENWINGINIGTTGLSSGDEVGPVTLVYQLGGKKLTVNISGYEH